MKTETEKARVEAELIDKYYFRFDERLQCHPEGIKYSFREKRGELHLPDHNAPHGPGVVKIFEALDPEVKSVIVFRDGKPFLLYERRDGKMQYAGEYRF